VGYPLHNLKQNTLRNSASSDSIFRGSLQCNPKPNGVILYELPNYKGKCITLADDSLGLAPVLDVHMLSIYGFSDLASSIRFVGSYATGWGALVFEHPSYYTEGRISHFASDDPDFSNDTIGRGRADSIQISRLSSQSSRNEAVVFVHGWQGTGSQLNEETVKDQFPDIRIRLMQAGYPIYYAVLKSSKDNGTPSIFSDENYNLLKEAIRKAKIESGKNKVILIAHSMGGLISRRYVNANNPDYAGDVSKLFTFGTPHEGIVFSMYETWIFNQNGGKPVFEYCNPPPQISSKLGNPPRDAACDYVYNMHEFNRLYPLRNDVNHYFVSGASPLAMRLTKTKFSNDGVTPLYSGRAANLSAPFINRLSTKSSHVLVQTDFPIIGESDKGLLELKGYFYDGPQYFKSGGTSSWLNCLKPVLNDNNISSCNGGDNGILPADVSPTATADDRKFISRQYRDFFRRDSDAGGVAFWQNHLINIGWSREQLIEEGFYNSNEFQTRGTAVIVRFYFAALNRRPDYSGLMDHVLGLYGDGNDPGKLYQRLGDIGQAFANSREFQDKYGSLDNRAFLTRVYQNVLNRDPDEGGLQDWLAYLESGQTRGQFLRDFLIAPEVRNRFRPREVLVSTIYATMLNCEPSESNYNFWVNGNRSTQSFIAEVLRDPNYINNGRCEG
jgi:pimeloyl-ACP methyl ester carboxylesterase